MFSPIFIGNMQYFSYTVCKVGFDELPWKQATNYNTVSMEKSFVNSKQKSYKWPIRAQSITKWYPIMFPELFISRSNLHFNKTLRILNFPKVSFTIT